MEPVSVRGRNWIASFAATIIAMMAIQMSSLGFSPLLPAIQKDFRLSYSQIGLFTGLYGLVAMAVSVPAGILAKRVGEKPALTGGLLGVAIGLLLLSQASTYELALGARVVWLLGYRVAFVCVMTSIALVAPPEFRSTAMGILGAMASLASVIGAPFGTIIAEPYGWRGGIIGFAVHGAGRRGRVLVRLQAGRARRRTRLRCTAMALSRAQAGARSVRPLSGAWFCWD